MTLAGSDEPLVVETACYRLELSPSSTIATLRSPEGAHWASLRLLAALDTVAGLDETLSVSGPRVLGNGGRSFEVERRSTLWERATTTLVCTEDTIEVRASVTGRGTLTDVHLLGGRSLVPGRPTGFLPSGSSFRTLFSSNPGDPARLLRSAGETAVIGASGDSQPGRGHWFFTPAPLYLALTTAEVEDPADEVPEGWLGLALAAPVEELTFVLLAYHPADRGFSLRLDYDGHTAVNGDFEAPTLVLTPGDADPYDGLRRHGNDLRARGAAPARRQRNAPPWWIGPIFCGWGAQSQLAATRGGLAADYSTQWGYDAFLSHLEGQGVVPDTVVIDDKWQEVYGRGVPDRAKWPDLRGWISDRRRRGQHVLLWWKAWSAQGLPPELCIRNPDGAAIVLDPTNPAARAVVREAMTAMLGGDGLDADGLKIDFTASTPTGRALSTHGPGWGLALLHELLAVVYDAAKEAKPDALIITHTPHPAFADVTDMLRLNDMLRLDDFGPVPPVLPQMRLRAEVVRAACPELPIDTDDWCVPDLETWRAYVELKPELGVPSLYYASHLDATGERLTPADYEALRRTWGLWREANAEERA